jgi:hypothetical protein
MFYKKKTFTHNGMAIIYRDSFSSEVEQIFY